MTFVDKYWNIVMDGDKNPFRQLPPMVRYQLMTVLAMMWSFIFCAMLGWFMWFPYYIVGHIVLLTLGALWTNYTFNTAYKMSHRDMYRSPDGQYAMHDDIWGS
jgi:hypothetical protein